MNRQENRALLEKGIVTLSKEIWIEKIVKEVFPNPTDEEIELCEKATESWIKDYLMMEKEGCAPNRHPSLKEMIEMYHCKAGNQYLADHLDDFLPKTFHKGDEEQMKMSNQDNNEDIKIYIVDRFGRSLAHRGYGPLIAESEDKVNDAVKTYLMDNTSILYDEECCDIFIDESTFDWEDEFGSSKFHKAKNIRCNVFYDEPISRTIYFTLEKPNDFID